MFHKNLKKKKSIAAPATQEVMTEPEQTVETKPEEYNLEDVFDMAYEGYVKTVVDAPLSRKEFRQTYWNDSSAIRQYLSNDAAFAAYQVFVPTGEKEYGQDDTVCEDGTTYEPIEEYQKERENQDEQEEDLEEDLPVDEASLFSDEALANMVEFSKEEYDEMSGFSPEEVDEKPEFNLVEEGIPADADEEASLFTVPEKNALVENEEEYKKYGEEDGQTVLDEDEAGLLEEPDAGSDFSASDQEEGIEDEQIEEPTSDETENFEEAEPTQKEKPTGSETSPFKKLLEKEGVLKKLRQSVFVDPDDDSMDMEFTKMTKEELLEQLLRVDGVVRKIPNVIEDVRLLYEGEVTDDGISKERLMDLFLKAVEKIRLDERFEYGTDFDKYLQSVLDLKKGELEEILIPYGKGGKLPITLKISGIEEQTYELTGISAGDLRRRMFQYEQILDSGVHLDILDYLSACGVTATESSCEISLFTFFPEHNRVFCLTDEI